MAAIEDAQKAYNKQVQKDARTAEKLKDCGKVDYQGIRKTLPVCVDGKPCEKCLAIWTCKHPPIVLQ